MPLAADCAVGNSCPSDTVDGRTVALFFLFLLLQSFKTIGKFGKNVFAVWIWIWIFGGFYRNQDIYYLVECKNQD